MLARLTALFGALIIVILFVARLVHADDLALQTYSKGRTGQESTATNVKMTPSRTALLVIDFWGGGVTDGAIEDNVSTAVRFARENGIYVVHAPHEGLDLYGLNEAILPLPPGEAVLGPDELLEDHFAERGLEITTVLVAGFSIEECILFSRPNSLNELKRRQLPLNVVLVKDATHGSYWGYKFALDAIEIAQSTTTLADLGMAFRQALAANPVVLTEPDWMRPYEVSDTIGDKFIPEHSMLVLVNPTGEWSTAARRERAERNVEDNLQPLLATARRIGMEVAFVTNGRPVHPSLAPEGQEYVVSSQAEIDALLARPEVETVLFAGNLTNTRPVFSQRDVWGFTISRAGTARTVLMQDAIIVAETPESLPEQRFLSVFLERAAAHGSDRHWISSRAALETAAARLGR